MSEKPKQPARRLNARPTDELVEPLRLSLSGSSSRQTNESSKLELIDSSILNLRLTFSRQVASGQLAREGEIGGSVSISWCVGDVLSSLVYQITSSSLPAAGWGARMKPKLKLNDHKLDLGRQLETFEVIGRSLRGRPIDERKCVERVS